MDHSNAAYRQAAGRLSVKGDLACYENQAVLAYYRRLFQDVKTTFP